MRRESLKYIYIYMWRTLFKRRALRKVIASVTLLQLSQKNICGISRAIKSCVKKGENG